jgi:putative membrane protein
MASKRTMAAFAALTDLVLVFPAFAHGTEAAGPGEFLQHWTLDPLVSVPLSIATGLYVLGLWRFRRRRPPAAVTSFHVTAFALAVATMVLALLSPLEAITGTVLSAHMVQHVLIITAAPLLFVLARPEVVWLRGLPEAWRRGMARSPGWRRFFRLVGSLSHPAPAALLHALALWIWHVPTLFDAALTREWLHWLEHLSFFATALLFWRGVLRARLRRETAPGALAACFLTMLHGGFLGALLTFAQRPLFAFDPEALAAWGLSPLGDQQLAGLIMWVPMGVVYMVAGLLAALRLIEPSEPADASAPART